MKINITIEPGNSASHDSNGRPDDESLTHEQQVEIERLFDLVKDAIARGHTSGNFTYGDDEKKIGQWEVTED